MIIFLWVFGLFANGWLFGVYPATHGWPLALLFGLLSGISLLFALMAALALVWALSGCPEQEAEPGSPV